MEITHPTVRVMVNYGARFARRALLNERPRIWCLLSGKSGCGKSRVARRACRVVRENAIDAYNAGFWPSGRVCSTAWADWPKLAEIKDAEDYEEAARDIREADVVFLDDLGAETDKFKSGEHVSRFRRLLNDLEGKAVMMTTNLKPSEWAKQWDERVESRLLMAKHLDCFEVPDFRPKIGAKAA